MHPQKLHTTSRYVQYSSCPLRKQMYIVGVDYMLVGTDGTTCIVYLDIKTNLESLQANSYLTIPWHLQDRKGYKGI